MLLCTLYVPVCIETHMNVELLPCREMCAEVRSSCQPALASRGFSWPDRFINCDNMSAEGTTAHCLNRNMARRALQQLQCTLSLAVVLPLSANCLCAWFVPLSVSSSLSRFFLTMSLLNAARPEAQVQADENVRTMRSTNSNRHASMNVCRTVIF